MTLSDFCADLLADSKPRRPNLGRALEINQRWRRREDGQVVVIRQIHRKDATVEIVNENRCDRRRCIRFGDFRDGYELLVDLRTGRA